jgi:hypothetical protein
MGYYTNIGPVQGPILHRHGPGYDAIGVLESPANHSPIGMALASSWDEQGRSIYRLIVHGVELPGRWIVVGREFWPVQ